ncbi:MAG TPA: hypothetical protein VEH52_08660 [Gaiellaceae bacterium]|nr:hypothetical protein [Gaiellaceae bacterium]
MDQLATLEYPFDELRQVVAALLVMVSPIRGFVEGGRQRFTT